jgi:CxxC motif-containing protein
MNAGAEIISGEFVCVVCPNGCAIDAKFVKGPPPVLISSLGEGCPRGNMWIRREIESPRRTVTTSVPVKGGDYICASVRTEDPVPLERVWDVIEALRDVELDAPVSIGQIVMTGPAGVSTTVIATRNVGLGS